MAENIAIMISSYHLSTWPMPVVMYVISVIMIFAVISGKSAGRRIVSFGLMLVWFWMGLMVNTYKLGYSHSEVILVTIISIISGLIFFVKGTIYDKLPFSFSANIQTYLSIFFLSFALTIEPIAAEIAGLGFPYSETIGLPGPTILFTLGLMITIEKPFPIRTALCSLIVALIIFYKLYTDSWLMVVNGLLVLFGIMVAVFTIRLERTPSKSLVPRLFYSKQESE